MSDSQNKHNLQGSSKWVDLSHLECVEHVEWILDPHTEDDALVYYLNLVDSTFPGGNVSDLIFHPDSWFKDDKMLDVNLTPEVIIGYLMAYTKKRLIGAEGVSIPDLPSSMDDVPPAVIEL